MTRKITDNVRIVELAKYDAVLRKLEDKYSTPGYYDLVIRHESGKIELTLKPFEKILEKDYTGRLFRRFC